MIQDQVHEAAFSPYFFVNRLIFSCIEHPSLYFVSIYYNDGGRQNRTLLFEKLIFCRMLQIQIAILVKVLLYRMTQRHH